MASTSYRYRVVDVFSDKALQGNPLAVFTNASGFPEKLMQPVALELNLSETVFVLPPEQPHHAARLRIFTPGKEVDFAGHPTIGTSFLLLDEQIVPQGAREFIVEENIGPITVTVDSGPRPKIWLTTPLIKKRDKVEPATAAGLLGLRELDLLPPAPQILDAGNPTLFIAVADSAAVDRIVFDTTAWTAFRHQHTLPMCVFAFAPTAFGAYSRMFAPDYGIREDPATGSSTGPLARYMMDHDLTPASDGFTFYSEQGTRMGRRSLLHIRIRGHRGENGIDVGGDVTPVIEGTLHL